MTNAFVCVRTYECVCIGSVDKLMWVCQCALHWASSGWDEDVRGKNGVLRCVDHRTCGECGCTALFVNRTRKQCGIEEQSDPRAQIVRFAFRRRCWGGSSRVSDVVYPGVANFRHRLARLAWRSLIDWKFWNFHYYIGPTHYFLTRIRCQHCQRAAKDKLTSRVD